MWALIHVGVILFIGGFFVVGKLADILEDTQAAKFTDKLYVALEDFQVALQKDKAKKRKVEKICLILVFTAILEYLTQ